MSIAQHACSTYAIELGFTYHHATADYLMLVQWLPDSPSRLPMYGGSYLGVGGFVLNENNEVLCIVEKYNKNKDVKIWKIPGGLIDPGEDIPTAAEREVFEETGIKAKFESLMCFRHRPEYCFGNADVYFVCKLVPETFKITKQVEEIAHCEWIPVYCVVGTYIRLRSIE